MQVDIPDFAELVLEPWLQPVTVVKAGIDYPIQAVFTRRHDPDRISGVPFATVSYMLDISSALAKSIGIDAQDSVLVDEDAYVITEPPFEEYSITRLMLRRV